MLLDKTKAFLNHLALNDATLYSTIQAADVSYCATTVKITFPHRMQGTYDYAARDHKIKLLRQAACFIWGRSTKIELELAPKPPPSAEFLRKLKMVEDCFGVESVDKALTSWE